MYHRNQRGNGFIADRAEESLANGGICLMIPEFKGRRLAQGTSHCEQPVNELFWLLW